MDEMCDLCRAKNQRLRNTASLPYLNNHICNDCKKPSPCNSCKSENIHRDGDMQMGYKVCLDCGYLIEHEVPVPPAHLQKKSAFEPFSEELLAWMEENTEYRISIHPNPQIFLKYS